MIVKRESETADLNSWSAMLSPACYRTYGFLAKVLHGSARGKHVSGAIGRGHDRREWRVFYDPENGMIRADAPYVCTGSNSVFPADGNDAATEGRYRRTEGVITPPAKPAFPSHNFKQRKG